MDRDSTETFQKQETSMRILERGPLGVVLCLGPYSIK
jgi:hypothetical protein